MRTTLLVLLTVGALRAAEPTRLEAAWADLAADDEAKALRAALAVAADKGAVKFLAARLRPVTRDPEEVGKLIAKLDAEAFDDRKAAFDELTYLGRAAKSPLRDALEDKHSVEVKARVKELLAVIDPPKAEPPAMIGALRVSVVGGKISINGVPIEKFAAAYAPPAPPKTPGVVLRAVRAAAVLEHLGTDDAKALLGALADGDSDAPPTKAAKEALGRLKAGR